MYGTIILPVVSCGYETWSLTLREEHKLLMIENRVLRKVFGPKRGEVTGVWKKLLNEGRHVMHCLPDHVRVNTERRMSWAERVENMGQAGKCKQKFCWEI
jgi:hypothetical protein